MLKKRKNNTKRKLNKKNFYTFLLLFFIFSFFTFKIFTTKITNIYISGNNFLNDQQIIDMAKLQDYPNSIKNISFVIKKRLQGNKYILSCKVKKNIFLNKVYIEVKENYPLFYYQVKDKTILYNGESTKEKFTIPTVINTIPNTVYDNFLNRIKQIDKDIFNRISEIKYDPISSDEERFFFTMNDGNYIYTNLDKNKFLIINKYLNIIKSFENKKGILYLDSGGYFDVFDK